MLYSFYFFDFKHFTKEEIRNTCASDHNNFHYVSDLSLDVLRSESEPALRKR